MVQRAEMFTIHYSLSHLQNEDMSALMHVLVGVEMLQCNKNPRRMEFTVPSLCTVCVSLLLLSSCG